MFAIAPTKHHYANSHKHEYAYSHSAAATKSKSNGTPGMLLC